MDELLHALRKEFPGLEWERDGQYGHTALLPDGAVISASEATDIGGVFRGQIALYIRFPGSDYKEQTFRASWRKELREEEIHRFRDGLRRVAAAAAAVEVADGK